MRDATITALTHKHAVQDKIDNENQFNALEKYYSRIFVGKENVSLSAIDKDPVLDPSQKLAVKGWMKKAVGGEGDDESKKTARLNQWYAAQQKVRSGEWQEQDLMRAANVGLLDPSDAKGLMTEVQTNREVPSTGKAIATVEGELPDIFKNKTKKAQFMRAYYDDIVQFRKINKREPSYKEAVEIGRELAKPDVESHFWSSSYSDVENDIRSQNPDATKPRYKQEAPTTYIQAQVNKIRKAGEWPQAVWDEEQNVFYLGKRDGYYYYQAPSGQTMREKAK